MFERPHEPLIPRTAFLWRLGRSALLALLVLGVALGIGVAGYHWIAGFGFTDALLNASMILSGMGPVGTLPDAGAKIFASAYALFSGLVFITVSGILLAPGAHRLMHWFHLRDEAA